MRVITREVRELVIYQAEKLGWNTAESAKALNLHIRTVEHIKKLHDDIGLVISDHNGPLGRPKLMSEDNINLMIALIERNPDIYIDEIADQLYTLHNVDVSLPTVYCAMKEVGYVHKKLSKTAVEHCAVKRMDYISSIASEPAENFVFVDECAVNQLNTYRDYGWAKKGRRARKNVRFVRGTRYSILPALTLGGVIFSRIELGAFNGGTFIEFVEDLVREMNPYPAPRSILVMDKCYVHHVDGIAAICEERGVRLVYLPPYSPDYNPIEEMFSWLKAHIRRNGTEFRSFIESKDHVRALSFLYHAMDLVEPRLIEKWFTHAGYL